MRSAPSTFPSTTTTAWHMHTSRRRIGRPDFAEPGDHWFVFGLRDHEVYCDDLDLQPHKYYEAIASVVMWVIDEQGESFWRTVERVSDERPSLAVRSS